MKTLFNFNIVLLAFSFFFMTKTVGQNIPININTNRIEYDQIFDFTNKTKSVLFYHIRDWILINDMPIIMLDSIGYSKIICQKLFKLTYIDNRILSTLGTKEYGIQYYIIFDLKDSRIRCKITNLNFLEYKNPSATGVYWGYGITTTNLKQGEILKYDAENFYPIEKNEKKYYEMYNFFFSNINNEIIETYGYIKNYINSLT